MPEDAFCGRIEDADVALSVDRDDGIHGRADDRRHVCLAGMHGLIVSRKSTVDQQRQDAGKQQEQQQGRHRDTLHLVERYKGLVGIDLDHHPPMQRRQIAPDRDDRHPDVIRRYPAAVPTRQRHLHRNRCSRYGHAITVGRIDDMVQRRGVEHLIALTLGKHGLTGQSQTGLVGHDPGQRTQVQLQRNGTQRASILQHRRHHEGSDLVVRRCIRLEGRKVGIQRAHRLPELAGQAARTVRAVQQIAAEIRLVLDREHHVPVDIDQQHIIKLPGVDQRDEIRLELRARAVQCGLSPPGNRPQYL